MSDELKATQIDRGHWFKMWETARAELAAEREKGWKAHAANLSLSVDNDALRAQLGEAHEALKPFAETNFSNGASDLDTEEVEIMHLRRARAVYEKIKGGGDE